MHSRPLELSLVPLPPRAEALPVVTPGPGWFESSWDLRRGLDVQEDFQSDLSPWLQRPRRLASVCA